MAEAERDEFELDRLTELKADPDAEIEVLQTELIALSARVRAWVFSRVMILLGYHRWKTESACS
jgi:hypothetical protein